jgi:hypothetical protein
VSGVNWLLRSAEEFPLDSEIGAELDDGGALRIRRFGEIAQFELVGFGELPSVVSHGSDERLKLLRRELDGDRPTVGLRLDCVEIRDESIDDLRVEGSMASGFEVGSQRSAEVLDARRQLGLSGLRLSRGELCGAACDCDVAEPDQDALAVPKDLRAARLGRFLYAVVQERDELPGMVTDHASMPHQVTGHHAAENVFRNFQRNLNDGHDWSPVSRLLLVHRLLSAGQSCVG